MMSLEEVKEQYKGKGGSNPECESILIDNGADREEGFVCLWSNKADASKIIERCGKSIVKYVASDHGVQFYIDRKAFRGIIYAFKKMDEEVSFNENKSKKMKNYWMNRKNNNIQNPVK